MNAFFFGSSDQQLFGYYHAPPGVERGAVVICPSWGTEYQYAHRALRTLAKRLSEAGMHVLRFDYSGAGDSWGDTTDGDLTRWQDDASAAVEELLAMSGRPKVDVIGLRMGAFVAARAAAVRRDIKRLILWDPVLDGRSWVREMDASVVGAEAVNAPIEFGSMIVNPLLVRQFESVTARDYPVPRVESVLCLQTQAPRIAETGYLPQLASASHAFVEDASPWLEDSSIWSGLVPARAISAISTWLVK